MEDIAFEVEKTKKLLEVLVVRRPGEQSSLLFQHHTLFSVLLHLYPCLSKLAKTTNLPARKGAKERVRKSVRECTS